MKQPFYQFLRVLLHNQEIATGCLSDFAIPIATKAALLSSMMLKHSKESSSEK